MERSRILISLIILVFAIFAVLSVCSEMGFFNSMADYDVEVSELDNELTIDMASWSYDEKNNIYYQLGIPYCTNPEDIRYETLGIYVPGDYFTAQENPDGTYTCKGINGHVGNYTAIDAPIVMPIDTPGYSAHKSSSTYNANEVKNYTDAGIVYVDAGCRGRENGGAPCGVTDLKAAVLYLKFNGETLPGDTSRIFSFGHSGGGAQSAILGASGDSELYTPYLESIGAALIDRNGNKLSDSICGAMAWCPITSLDTADAAYEWGMGQYSSEGTRGNGTWTGALSDDLAISYAKYINDLHLQSSNWQKLTLEESENGIYTSGSYYDYMLSVIEGSLNNFLNDTKFPYAPKSSDELDIWSAPRTGAPSGDVPDDFSSDVLSSQTYQTPQDYIDALNGDGEWVIYDNSSNTVKITSIGEFVKHCKNPSKDTGAFDDLERGQAENELFGNDDKEALHFDSQMAEILKENSNKYDGYSDYYSSYPGDYASDLTRRDKFNNTIETRVNMYNPLYFLCDYYEGSETAHPAKYWRINSGLEQGDTSFTVETNLALALEHCDDVESVEFNPVWGQGHTKAERTGSPDANFMNWINECLNEDSGFFLFDF